MKLIVQISFFILTCHLSAQISDFKEVDFKKADSTALANKGENLNNLPLLAFNLTSRLKSDVEQFRAIYMWVCSTIKNDYRLYSKNMHKRNKYSNDSLKLKLWNDEFRKTAFKTLLKKQQTVCTGYAYIVKELATLANLECKIINGYAKVSTTNVKTLNTPNHSWNAVKLNNKWYLCDPTWASGIPSPKTNRFTFHYNDGFFLAQPKLFATNHFPEDKTWWLTENHYSTLEDFKAAPILYGSAYNYLTELKSPRQMHQKVKRFETVYFEYELSKSISAKQVHFLIDDGDQSRTISPKFISLKNGDLKMQHQFKSTGFYDVHLYFEDKIIATYTFKVT